MVDVWFGDPMRLMLLTGVQWDIIWLLQGVGWLDFRKVAFESYYGVTITTYPNPPPFDVLVEFDPFYWGPIYDYGDETNFSATQADCEILAFKGNQGGTWPALWP